MPGVVLPAEWKRQACIQITWPNRDSAWGPRRRDVEDALTAVVREAAGSAGVLIAASAPDYTRTVLENGGATGASCVVYPIATNDVWARDYAPVTVFRGEQPVLLDFQFNGWGQKFEAGLDNALSRRLYEAGAYGDAPLETESLVLEGGALESDGAGTLLTTAACIPSATRNPGRSRADIEQELIALFGLERVVWLEHGALFGDDTDSHIDMLARFVAPDAIAYCACDDTEHPDFEALHAMEAELRALRTLAGHPYTLVPLPVPAKRLDPYPLPATYANFLMLNHAVLVPVYGDPNDDVACERLDGLVEDRPVVPIDCSATILQCGAVHCLTMQFPEGVPLV